MSNKKLIWCCEPIKNLRIIKKQDIDKERFKKRSWYYKIFY